MADFSSAYIQRQEHVHLLERSARPLCETVVPQTLRDANRGQWAPRLIIEINRGAPLKSLTNALDIVIVMIVRVYILIDQY